MMPKARKAVKSPEFETRVTYNSKHEFTEPTGLARLPQYISRPKAPKRGSRSYGWGPW